MKRHLLRRKLEDDGRNPSLIKTVRGGGYVLAATVEKLSNGGGAERPAGERPAGARCERSCLLRTHRLQGRRWGLWLMWRLTVRADRSWHRHHLA